MLNYLWTGMIALGIVWGALTGNLEAVGSSILDSAQSAVTLCITMLGIMCMWTGLMHVAKMGGLITQLTHFIAPFVRFLFPEIPDGHPAREHISLNIAANLLGLGWASTPSGLSAMKELAELNRYRPSASNAMCNFLILNISSLQLIPVSVIAYRSQYHAANPSAIIGPALAATFASSLAAVLFIKLIPTGPSAPDTPRVHGHS